MAKDADLQEIIHTNIQVNDINDNAPIFPKDYIAVNISENSPKGTSINLDRFQAVDRDIGKHLMYHDIICSIKISLHQKQVLCIRNQGKKFH